MTGWFRRLDSLVAHEVFRSRSEAIQKAVAEKLARLDPSHLGNAVKLLPGEEQQLADEGMGRNVASRMARILRGDVVWAELIRHKVTSNPAGVRLLDRLSHDVWNERSAPVVFLRKKSGNALCICF